MAQFRTPLGITLIVDREDLPKIKQLRFYEQIVFRCCQPGMEKGQSRLLHHILAGIKKIPPGHVVDHVNGNPLDLRKRNLRLCTHAQNAYNRRAFRNKYKGVWLKKTRSGRLRWQMCIYLNGKQIQRVFDTERQAVEKYNEMAKALFGEYAKLNVWTGPSRRVKPADLAPRPNIGSKAHRARCPCLVCRRHRACHQRRARAK